MESSVISAVLENCTSINDGKLYCSKTQVKFLESFISSRLIFPYFSEITPTTATLLAELCHEIGLPRGVLNIVHGVGPRCGQAMIEHKGIMGISFTGGTATGAIVAASAGRTFKKLSLELGGKNPNVIFAGLFQKVLFFCELTFCTS